jgi:AcrR family transcriptional regulator
MVRVDGLRERKRAHTRATTVEVALRLFAARGYDAVTVADICEAAEIAPRTFFRYFPSKDDVLAEPARAMAVRVEAEVAAARPDLADEEVLRAAVRALGGDVIAQRRQLVNFVTVVRLEAARRNLPMLGLPAQERRLADLLTARRPGATVPPDPDWRTRLLVAQVTAAFRVWFDDFVSGAFPEPLAHLDEVLSKA